MHPHQGAVRTNRAKLTVYWPGINNDIDNVILTCKQCQDSQPSLPKEPLTVEPRPSRPLQELAVDFCSYAGCDFLIIVDCHADWTDIIHMDHNTTTPTSSQHSSMPSAAQECQTLYGQTMGPNSHPNSFNSSRTTGNSDTLPHLQCTHKAMVRLKQRSNP